MTEERQIVNNVAPLRNVTALIALIDRLENRAFGLPGMACFYGHSGYGKTTAACHAENARRAYQVQVKSTWARKKFCEATLAEMSLRPEKTIGDMVDQIGEHLAVTGATLIIDEADFLVDRNMIEIVRDIHESSQSPVILIGEELLPQKLMRWERIHGRMTDWVRAQEATLDDVNQLCKSYGSGIAFDSQMHAAILKHSQRSIRRISINIARIAEHARVRGLETITLEDWDARQFFTGEAPTPLKGLA